MKSAKADIRITKKDGTKELIIGADGEGFMNDAEKEYQYFVNGEKKSVPISEIQFVETLLGATRFKSEAEKRRYLHCVGSCGAEKKKE